MANALQEGSRITADEEHQNPERAKGSHTIEEKCNKQCKEQTADKEDKEQTADKEDKEEQLSDNQDSRRTGTGCSRAGRFSLIVPQADKDDYNIPLLL